MARRLLQALAGLAAGGAALLLAAHHPLWPAPALCAVLLWAALSARWSGLWLTVVPALLPVLDFAPWSGWTMVDEFDLLLLATLAGGWLGRAADGSADALPRASRGFVALASLCAAVAVFGLGRGWAAAGGGAFDGFQDHAGPTNGLRVTKGVLFALLLAPLLRREFATAPARAMRRVCIGMWAGMTVVVAAVLWERLAYPGLLEFSSPYRTTALFWEMHVGGAALDVYAALATPFAAWAVVSARSGWRWAAAALLAVAWGYVCLTTFSRGVYLAAVVSLTLLLWLRHRRHGRRGPRRARVGDGVLVLALLAEALLVLGTGSFMGRRLAAADRDLSSRTAHWRDGLGLLHTPADWLLGIGAGRLPARYAAEVPRREFSGAARSVQGAPGPQPSHLELAGPKRVASLGGLYGLTQRVPLVADARYRVQLAVRARTATELRILVCEMHLLYLRQCQSAGLQLPASPIGPWLGVDLPLTGPSLDSGRAYAPRLGMLVLSVANAGGVVEISDVRLQANGRAGLVANGRFADGLAHWFPVAQRYFLPWHIDNLLLETLIERGAAGALLAAALLGFATRSALRAGGAGAAAAPFVVASLGGVLAVGLVSSVMDMPRVAFLFCLLTLTAASLPGGQSSTTPA